MFRQENNHQNVAQGAIKFLFCFWNTMVHDKAMKKTVGFVNKRFGTSVMWQMK